MKIYFAIIAVLFGCLVTMSHGQGYVRLARGSQRSLSMTPDFEKWKNIKNAVARKENGDMLNDGNDGLQLYYNFFEKEMEEEYEKRQQQEIKKFISRHPSLMERYLDPWTMDDKIKK